MCTQHFWYMPSMYLSDLQVILIPQNKYMLGISYTYFVVEVLEAARALTKFPGDVWQDWTSNPVRNWYAILRS